MRSNVFASVIMTGIVIGICLRVHGFCDFKRASTGVGPCHSGPVCVGQTTETTCIGGDPKVEFALDWPLGCVETWFFLNCNLVSERCYRVTECEWHALGCRIKDEGEHGVWHNKNKPVTVPCTPQEPE